MPRGVFKHKKMSPETKQKISLARQGVKNYLWKGEKAGLKAKHLWLKTHYGNANRCENRNCTYPRLSAQFNVLTAPMEFQWANISKKYLRDITDYVQLCVSCHQLYDCGRLDPFAPKKKLTECICINYAGQQKNCGAIGHTELFIEYANKLKTPKKPSLRRKR